MSQENEEEVQESESEQQQSDEGNKTRPLRYFKVLLGMLIILVCSIQVYFTAVATFNHSRLLIRSMHYYILNHTDPGIYWTGQEGLNYPIHQFYLLGDFNDFLTRMQYQLANFEQMVFGTIDQTLLNSTQQFLYVQRKNGVIDTYGWTIAQGIHQPFQDLDNLKQTLLDCQLLNIPIQAIDINNHIWNFRFEVEPFSQASTIVQLFAEQKISLASEHILTSALGLILLLSLLRQNFFQVQYHELPDYLLACLLLLTGSLSFTEMSAQILVILDGVTCLMAYLWILKFYTREDDYHISLLIRRSYIYVGRLFVSFGPVFIAFGLLAFICFSRYAGQFKTLWRTFLSLFYISYYNMTYQSFIVTARANPISIIFFIVFVLLFTICVYSAMLVSVFCSYVWNKRQQKIKKDIIENLNIQCSSCNYKYKYTDSIKKKYKLKQLSSLSLLPLNTRDDFFQYKRTALSKVNFFSKRIGQFMQNMQQDYKDTPHSPEFDNTIRVEYWALHQKIKQLMKTLPRNL